MRLTQQLKDRIRKAIGVQRLAVEAAELRTRLEIIEAELWNRPHTAEGRSLVLREGQPGAAFGYINGETGADSTYAGFEDVFRGSDAFIRDRLRGYLPLLPQVGDVLDIGCGRGEMLEVLRDSGLRATGVDADEGMVERCRRAGHTVVHADALEYLLTLPEASLDVIFSAQVIEHMDPSELVRLLAESRRVLRPEGLLIAETVNPHCLSALRTFWVDLSHVKPIFPETLLVLCRDAGFPSADITFPNGSGDFEHDRRHTGEFAAVARLPR